MKNKLYGVSLLAIALCLTGCAEDQYEIEKRYWHLRKKTKTILNNPYGAPPAQYQQAIGDLKEFILKYPDSLQAVDAELVTAKLYLAAGAYSKSRQAFEELIARYDSSILLAAEIYYLIGNTYEKEGEWEKAQEYYKKVITEYPETEQGLLLPMYIAKYYKQRVKETEMKEAYLNAVTHYRGIARSNLGTELAFKADMLSAKAYTELRDWKNALQTLEMIIYEYHPAMNVEGALVNKVLIYSRELKDEVKARESLMELAEFYPDSRFLKLSEQQILLKEVRTE